MPLICFASPKGGVGKTTLAANVADALRRSGQRVLALDLDPQNALRLHFGLPLQDNEGFAHELARRPDWRNAVRETPSGVILLPHGAVDIIGALDLATALEREPELLAAPLRAILADPDLMVVADMPPGASRALTLVAPHAAMIVAVLLADAGSAALVPEIESGRFLGAGSMTALFAGRLRVALNQLEPESRLSAAAAESVARRFGPRLLGAIRRDVAVAEALASQRLLLDLAPGSLAAQDLAALVRGIAAARPAMPEIAAAGWAGR
ncbi:AAA family ATPase [Belnapia sp. T6]|uniref:AAA family ATPase n=1 Tax=Belnapia mucosa TaxID=2804532 RepID=A0ABS1UZS3_9PROT|nr:cellulose synthase operon protein YhjQ/BcsQ [Belnapia mucosa]MBL6454953.1 AAA family ATPase [Belnapia mucosa]